MDIHQLVAQMRDIIIGWPLIIFVIAVGIICTFMFGFVQLRYFFASWKYTLFPPKGEKDKPADMTPFQAFLNTLSASMGNGSIGGMAVALHLGGPGAAAWVVIIGILLMSVRFAEVYLSTFYGAEKAGTSILGGPMVYLRKVIGGEYVAWLYAFFAMWFGFVVGNAIQANTMHMSISQITPIPALASAIVLLLFIAYVVFGGAKRIVKVSDAIVPIKVAVFFLATIVILFYHWPSLIPAIRLMIKGAFTPLAFAGGALGYSVQQAMRFGMNGTILATESGLGTAAILFGGTASKTPVQDGIMSMLTTFISTCVCFIICLCIIASGSSFVTLTSTALTTASFNTVFGVFGAWVVSFLSVSFGIGVLVAYAYITRAAFLFLTNGWGEKVFAILYCLFAFGGALVKVDLVWDISQILNALMLVINLFGILCLLKVIKKGLNQFQAS